MARAGAAAAAGGAELSWVIAGPIHQESIAVQDDLKQMTTEKVS